MKDEKIKVACELSEKYILASMLCKDENAAKGIKSFTEDDFNHPFFKKLFKTIGDVVLEKGIVDIHSIAKRIEGDHDLNGVDGFSFLEALKLDGEQVHFEGQANDLKSWTAKRQLTCLTKALFDDLKTDADPFKVIEKYKKTISDIEKNKPQNDATFQYLLENNSETKIIDALTNISPGVRTGFTIGDINLELPGGALSVIALPTGHGKTTCMINFSLGVLNHHHDKSVYFFTYEENEAAILTYFLNTWVGKNLSKNNRRSIQSYFREKGSLEFITEKKMKEEFVTCKDSFFKERIDNGRLRVFYTDMTVEELVASIRFLKKNTNVGLICIDYIQCLKLLKEFSGSRQEELKEISDVMKNVAVETGLPIFLGAQFNREVVCEADLSPVKIREAADIEHRANLIIGGWNRTYAGFSREGNKGKDRQVIPSESAIYLEIMKGRGIGNGHNSILDFDGNIGMIKNRLNENQNISPITIKPNIINKIDPISNIWSSK